jgi:hypothetical protein
VVLLNDASSTAKFTFNRMSLGQDHKWLVGKAVEGDDRYVTSCCPEETERG